MVTLSQRRRAATKAPLTKTSEHSDIPTTACFARTKLPCRQGYVREGRVVHRLGHAMICMNSKRIEITVPCRNMTTGRHASDSWSRVFVWLCSSLVRSLPLQQCSDDPSCYKENCSLNVVPLRSPLLAEVGSTHSVDLGTGCRLAEDASCLLCRSHRQFRHLQQDTGFHTKGRSNLAN